MTHDIAVRTIVSLVPEIEKQGAETVLLNYAERENLPPAQLEKLAQVFNTFRTLDHIDKQASAEARGSAVSLVDVPDLVVKYINATSQEKAATPIRTSSHNPATIDLLSAVRFDAPQIKAASAPSTPAPRRLSKQELADTALELSIDARVAMEKIATELLNKLPQWSDGSRDISTAIADAAPLCNIDTLKQAVQWLKSASAAPLVGVDFDKPMTKRAFAVTGECGKLLAEFNYEFASYKLMRKMAAEGVEPKKPGVGDIDELVEAAGGEEAARQILDDMMAERGMSVDDLEGDDTSATRPGFVIDSPNGENEDEAADTKPTAPDSTAPAAPQSTGQSRVAKVLKSLSAPIRATGNAISETAQTAKSHIDRVVSKDRVNKDQMSSDMDVEDVRRAIGIRRMIGTDPVLREADPREVLEIYNAIARTNPEIVHNMPALRLLLREAVSYEGLTLDSQKQLTDIRSNSSKAEEQEANNLKRRYTIAGDSSKSKTK